MPKQAKVLDVTIQPTRESLNLNSSVYFDRIPEEDFGRCDRNEQGVAAIQRGREGEADGSLIRNSTRSFG